MLHAFEEVMESRMAGACCRNFARGGGVAGGSSSLRSGPLYPIVHVK
jgi:hypothetical protein